MAVVGGPLGGTWIGTEDGAELRLASLGAVSACTSTTRRPDGFACLSNTTCTQPGTCMKLTHKQEGVLLQH